MVYYILIRVNNTVLYLLLFGKYFFLRLYVIGDNNDFVTVNSIRSGQGTFKEPPPKFCPHVFDSGATLL